jgi:hypothetical protein
LRHGRREVDVKHRIAAALAASALASGGAFAQQYEFDCTITQATSGVAGTLTVSATLPGTLIGNYDAATNPTGTRTKPGLFGSFGSTENVASPVSIVAGFNNVPLNTRPSGSFRLLLDVEGLSARVEGYEVNNLATGPLVIPVTAAVTLQTFRTRAPDSTFIGATVNQEVGDATITTFRDIQSENGNGTLVVAGPDQYTFTVPITVLTILEGDLLDAPIGSPEGTPSAIIVTGTATVRPDGTVAITSTQALDATQTQTPNQALPPQPFPLPTILPPGGTANVLLNLTLQSFTSTIAGTRTLTATGTPALCFADFNRDGGVDGADIEAFFVDWSAGENGADVNRDGGVDGGDVQAFFLVWQAGGC